MSRTLSTTVLDALYASRTGAIFCALISISHSELAETLYLTNNGEALTYGGHTYLAFPFKFDPPDENESTFSNAKLTIDATDQSIMQAIRSISTAPSISIDAIYISDDGGTIEKVASWPFQLTNVSGDVNTITGDLVYDTFLDNEMGPIEMTPTTCPGVN
jgi:hypothetical protein